MENRRARNRSATKTNGTGKREHRRLEKDEEREEKRRGQCISIRRRGSTASARVGRSDVLFAESERTNERANGRTSERVSERMILSLSRRIAHTVGAKNRKILKNLSLAGSPRGTISSMARCLPPCGIPDGSRGENRRCETVGATYLSARSSRRSGEF